jgi:hypothetical protein
MGDFLGPRLGCGQRCGRRLQGKRGGALLIAPHSASGRGAAILGRLAATEEVLLRR